MKISDLTGALHRFSSRTLKGSSLAVRVRYRDPRKSDETNSPAKLTSQHPLNKFLSLTYLKGLRRCMRSQEALVTAISDPHCMLRGTDGLTGRWWMGIDEGIRASWGQKTFRNSVEC
jgi:hypothetical protein